MKSFEEIKFLEEILGGGNYFEKCEIIFDYLNKELEYTF
jgi:hypothetical protein